MLARTSLATMPLAAQADTPVAPALQFRVTDRSESLYFVRDASQGGNTSA